MTIVSTRDFRANQTKYVGMALQGHNVILRSRQGCVQLKPVPTEKTEKPKRKSRRRDVTAEICQGMKDWKEFLETGKSDKFLTWEDMMHELRD